MPFAPSKNPGDYESRPWFASIPAEARPPYLVLISLASAGAALVVLLALAAGALSETKWIWLLLFAMWFSRSQVERWWADRHGGRDVSWLPALGVSLACLVLGLVATTLLDTRHDRALALSIALVTGWVLGDGFDGLRRRRGRAVAAR